MIRACLLLTCLALACSGCATRVGTQIRVEPGSEMAKAMREMDAARRAAYERARQERLVNMPLDTMFPDPQLRALAKAAREGRVRTIDRLVQEGADVNARGKANATPLFWSMGFTDGDAWPWSGSVRGFERLLQLGADPNALLDKDGKVGEVRVGTTSVVHWSVYHPNRKFLELALAYGGDPNLAAGLGEDTPIFGAMLERQRDKFFLLLEAGADIDFPDWEGGSPLTELAVFENWELLLEMLKRGGDYRSGRLAEEIRRELREGPPDPQFAESWEAFLVVVDWLKAQGLEISTEDCPLLSPNAWSHESTGTGTSEPPNSQLTHPAPAEPDAGIVRFRDAMRSGGDGPQMAVIPGGRFRMGCNTERPCKARVSPAHDVTVRSFALSVHEVTFGAYDRFTDAERADDAGWGRGSRPVINVTWDEAKAYAAWLSGETGEHYRLPTEAEWEYAARAGTRTRFPWGDGVGVNRVNCQHWTGCEPCGESWEHTAPVGSFPANAWGLHDMLGNVEELVEDCFHRSYEGAPADGSARDERDCPERVVRGGGHTSPLGLFGVDERFEHPVRGRGSRSTSTGFRVVRELPAADTEGH